MTRYRVVTDLTELEALRPAWRRLLGNSPTSEPVQTPLWLLAWWRQFGEADGRALRVVVVEDGAELVGLVPLATQAASHRRAIPVRRIALLGTGEDESEEVASEYVGGPVAAGRHAEVARSLASALVDEALGPWDELRMSAMSGEDPLAQALASALRTRGVDAEVTPTGECHTIPLPATWAVYLAALDSSRRYMVTRSLRELDKWAGKDGWTLRLAGSAGELDEGRRVLLALHAKRWGSEGQAGVFARSARFRAFHDDVMPRLLAGEDGASLELLWLVARGEPIAAAYNVVYGNKLYFYQCGRRVDLPKPLRAGIALHALAIRRSIEEGRREYDFLEGDSRYKRELALASRSLVTLRAVAPHFRGRAVEVARMLAERAIERVRSVRQSSFPPPPIEHRPE